MGAVRIRISGICAFFMTAAPQRMLMLNARDVRNTANEQEIINGHVASIRWAIEPSLSKPPGADLLGPNRNLAATLLRGELISVRSTVTTQPPVVAVLPEVPRFADVAGPGYTLKPEYSQPDPSKLKSRDVLGRIDFYYGNLSNASRTDLWHFFPSPLKADVRIAQQVTWSFAIISDDLELDLIEFESGAKRTLIIPPNDSGVVEVDICNCMEEDIFAEEVSPTVHLHGPDWHFESYYQMFQAPAGAARPAVPYLSGWDEEPLVDQTGEALHGGNCPPLNV
jgi:hypothetical protein